jgi:6-bladed beta-propeller
MRLAAATAVLALDLLAQSPPASPWRATLTISDETDARAAELGKVFGLATDSAGNIYAADIDNAFIVVFGPDGRFRGQVGRKGRGPGEFQAPTGLVIDARQRLWVRDTERITRFTRDQRTGLIASYDTAYQQPLYPDWRNARTSRVHASGDYLHTAPTAMVGAQLRVLRYNDRGQVTDSLMVPRWPNETKGYARYQVLANGGRMLRGLDVPPFTPVPSWDVTPRGTIVSTGSDRYEIRETDASGRVLRTLTGQWSPVVIVPAERAESLAAMNRRLDSIPVPLSKVEGMSDDVKARKLPTHYPAIQSLFAAADGTTWVRRWAGLQRGRTLFDVFDANGRLQRSVVLPAVILDAPTPVLGARRIVAAVEDRETGGVRLMRFEP